MYRYAAERKKECEENIIQELQDRYSRNEVWKFCERVRNIKRGFQPRITVCRVKIGNLIADERQILKRWAECFEERLSSSAMQPLNAETAFFGPELHIPVRSSVQFNRYFVSIGYVCKHV
jgi:hypothetical protein